MKDVTKRYLNYGKMLYDMTGGIIGYIVPAAENGKLIERAFLKHSNAKTLSRPFAWVGFDKESGMLLYYKHCMSEDFMDTEKYPPTVRLKGEFSSQRTPAQQAEYESRLWEAYKKIRGFVLRENLTDEQKALVAEYRRIWELAVMTDLIPYYKALSKEFFEWLENNA